MPATLPGTASLLDQLDSKQTRISITIILVYLTFPFSYCCKKLFPLHNNTLHNHTSEEVIVVLRDGKHVVGTLRSFDQFCKLLSFQCIASPHLFCCVLANFILENSFERRYCEDMYGDIPLVSKHSISISTL